MLNFLSITKTARSTTTCSCGSCRPGLFLSDAALGNCLNRLYHNQLCTHLFNKCFNVSKQTCLNILSFPGFYMQEGLKEVIMFQTFSQKCLSPFIPMEFSTKIWELSSFCCCLLLWKTLSDVSWSHYGLSVKSILCCWERGNPPQERGF